VHLVDPVRLHVEQARQAGSDPAAAFTAVVGDARELAAPGESQDAVVLLGRDSRRQRFGTLFFPLLAVVSWPSAGAGGCSSFHR
jgi:hypothetical protein